ncbi:hypothetical protein V6N13_063987 [Hibiscus sabdariffa]
MGSIRAFHEQPTDVKTKLYTRDLESGVIFLSNFDLFHSKAASWRDTLQIKLGRRLPKLEDIPEVIRDEVVQWNLYSETLGEQLMGLLSEGLGLDMDRLKNTCLDAKLMVGNYYPHCPQPDLTVGIASHSDPGVLTLVLQDHIGGLQIKHKGEWVDVKPVHGALVINIADILQILSNDEYISVEHRVLANPSKEARVSVAVFFNPSAREALHGPFSELISPEKPPRYRQFAHHDYMTRSQALVTAFGPGTADAGNSRIRLPLIPSLVAPVIAPEKKTATTLKDENHYDRAVEVKRFDESKLGVKGLVGSGLTTIPSIFIHPPETLSDLKPKPKSVVIPAINLSGRRLTVVKQVVAASRTFGIFQIVNHGVSVQVLDRMMGSMSSWPMSRPNSIPVRWKAVSDSFPTSTCFTPKPLAGGFLPTPSI